MRANGVAKGQSHRRPVGDSIIPSSQASLWSLSTRRRSLVTLEPLLGPLLLLDHVTFPVALIFSSFSSFFAAVFGVGDGTLIRRPWWLELGLDLIFQVFGQDLVSYCRANTHFTSWGRSKSLQHPSNRHCALERVPVPGHVPRMPPTSRTRGTPSLVISLSASRS